MERKDKVRLVLAALVLFAALGMISLGAARGELNTLFQKAVNICFECIGLG